MPRIARSDSNPRNITIGQTALFAVFGPAAREIGLPGWSVGAIVLATAFAFVAGPAGGTALYGAGPQYGIAHAGLAILAALAALAVALAARDRIA